MKKIILALLIATTLQANDCDKARTEFCIMGVKQEAAISGRFYREAHYYQRKQIASIVKIRGFCKLDPTEKKMIDRLDVISKESLVLMEKLADKLK